MIQKPSKIKQFCVGVLLFIIGIYGSAAVAQTHGPDIVITKKDGKFQGVITASTFGTYPGIIKDIELRFVWSGIFDQPTEYYQFVWNKSDSVQYGGKLFGRTSLGKYPDLQRRFDDLRPGKIELSVGIFFGSQAGAINDYSGQSKVDDRCLQGYEDQYGCGLGFSKTITEIPHLMVAAPGKVGDNITPTSPVDNWVGFFETRHLSGDPQTINRKLHDMMRRADKIRVRDLRLVRYSVPSDMISDIIEEFYKREAEEAEKELEQEATTPEQEDEKSFMDKVTDFFGGDDGEEGDDFWSGENESSTNKGDDFWSGEEVQTPIQPGTSHQAEIVTRGNEQGVLAKTGEILIPFRRWTISSYTDGIAEVSIRDDSTPTVRVPGCGGGRIWTSLSGSVDQSGEWLAPPKRKKYSRTNVSLMVFYRSINDSRNLTPAQTRARDQCRIQVQSQLNELERRYNVPVTNWK